jgi:hypothetical protein
VAGLCDEGERVGGEMQEVLRKAGPVRILVLQGLWTEMGSYW